MRRLLIAAWLILLVLPIWAQSWELEATRPVVGPVGATTWAYHYDEGTLWLITAGHVVRGVDPETIRIRKTPDDKWRPASLVDWTFGNYVDVAVLRVGKMDREPVYQLGETAPVGTHVRVFGFVGHCPNGLAVAGDIAGDMKIWSLPTEPLWQVMTTHLGPGASGAAVLYKKKVVGLTVVLLPCDFGSYNVCVPINDIKEWLRSHRLMPDQLGEPSDPAPEAAVGDEPGAQPRIGLPRDHLEGP